MLIPMLIQQPRMLGTVLQHTPVWVWGLLAGLIGLGLSQARARTAGLARVALMPVVMTTLSLWGTVSAFGGSPLFGYVMLAWMVGASVTVAAVAPIAPARGSDYDAATRTFTLPATWVPLVLILGIFLTRYVVNVDLAMQPGLARDGQYTLLVGALYGLFSGIFIGRAARLWRLAYHVGSSRLQLQRNPW